jgi:branched-chain amino acid transport system substrate-binding protein
VKKLLLLAVLGASIAVAVAVGYSSSARSATSVSPLPTSSCGPVFYKGTGQPQFLIASDLPLQGAGRAQNIDMEKAIQYVLDKQYHFKAGKYTIGYQGCDDSTAQTAAWDTAKCTANGRAYASNRSLIGLLGTFNSGCSKLIIPLINRAPGGPLGMLSVANTAVELTHTAAWTQPGEPGVYYPTGKRNYLRLAASDDYQGPAAALLMQKLRHVKKVFIIHDNQTFGKGVANAFKLKAQSLGMQVVGFEPWDPKATSYEAIGQDIKASGADGVYLGGLVCDNGAKLLKDLRAAVGPGPAFFGPDGWTPYSATLAAGSAAQGMYITYAGLPLEKLGTAGKAFIAAFSKSLKLPKGTLPPPYSIYQAQGAQIMLEAIKHSNGTRTSVTSNLFKTNIVNGIMGTFHFDKNGDIVPTKAISLDVLKGNTGVPAGSVILKVKG